MPLFIKSGFCFESVKDVKVLREPYYKIIVVIKSHDKYPEDSDEIDWMNFRSAKEWRMLEYFEATVSISYWCR